METAGLSETLTLTYPKARPHIAKGCELKLTTTCVIKKTGNVRLAYSNKEKRSRNHCCCGNAISIKYEFVFILMPQLTGMELAPFLRRIMSFAACPIILVIL